MNKISTSDVIMPTKQISIKVSFTKLISIKALTKKMSIETMLTFTKISFKMSAKAFFIFLSSFFIFTACKQKINEPERIILSPIVKNTIQIQDTDIKDVATNKTEIGILFPFSGKEGKLGKDLVKYVRLGLGNAQDFLNISSYDGSDDQVIKNYSNEILDKQTKIILGPISSDKIEATDLSLDNNNVAITLSNDLSKKTKNVIIFGHEPIKQSEKLFSYLIGENISTNIIIFLPENELTKARIKKLKELILRDKGKCLLIKTYNNNDENLTNTKKDLEEIKKLANKFNESTANLTKLGLYIADFGESLDNLIKIISETQLDKIVNVIGDNRLEGTKIDAIFTTSVNYKNMDLNFYTETMNYKEKLSYDMGLLVRHFIKDNLSIEDLKNTNKWYKGLSGYFKIVNGVTKRQYDIVKRKSNEIFIVKSAAHQEDEENNE